MLAGFQSANQSNIVDNNVNSSINNKVANVNDQAMNSIEVTSETNIAEIHGDLTISDKCSFDQINEAKAQIDLHFTSLSSTNTQFDNHLSTNITNDLQNDNEQEAAGIGGGFLSAQISNQLQQVSNDVSNKIANEIFTKRKKRMEQFSTATLGNKLVVDGNVACSGEGSITQRNLSTKNIAMDFFSKDDDTVKIVNDIHTAMSNKLHNTSSQSGSDFAAALMAVVLIFFLMVGSGAGSINEWFKKHIMPPLVACCLLWPLYWLILFNQYKGDRYQLVKPDTGFLGSIGAAVFGSSWCDSGDFPTPSPSGITTDDCFDFYNDLNKWGGSSTTSNWSANTIRNSGQMDIKDTYTNKRINYDTLKKDVNQPEDCPADFSPGPSPSKCRSATEDFLYENYLKMAFSCADGEITGDMLNYHHEIYSDPSLAANNKVKIRHDGGGGPIDKSVSIIQPGTGYLTGGPYLTSCKRADGLTPCCADGTNDCPDLEVYLRSDSSCSSSEAAFNDSAITDSKKTSGYGCYNKASEKPGFSDSSLSEYIYGSAASPPQDCALSSLAQNSLTGWIDGGLGICPRDTEGKECVQSDKCYMNYYKQLLASDLTAGGNDSTLDLVNLGTYCPYGTKGGDCIFELGGVNQIKISNYNEAIKNASDPHIQHPDNIYTIMSDPPSTAKSISPGGVPIRKAIYKEGSGFDVLYERVLMDKKPENLDTSLSIWATSALIKTSNDTVSGASFGKNSTEAQTICEVDAAAVSKRKWPGMGNICEAKFKLQPMLSKDGSKTPSSPPGGEWRKDLATGKVTFGCDWTDGKTKGDNPQKILDILKYCKCEGGEAVSLESQYTDDFWTLLWLPPLLILLVVGSFWNIGLVLWNRKSGNSDQPTSSGTDTASSKAPMPPGAARSDPDSDGQRPGTTT